MKLGLSSYTFGWAVGVPGHEPTKPMNEQDLLDRCDGLDVRLLQIGDNLPLHTLSASRVSQLSSRAAADGVQLEVGARGLMPDRIIEYVAIARQLRASFLRFVIDDAEYRPEPKTVLGILREAACLLEGITLGIENHDRFTPETLRSIVDGAGSDRIGVCFDTANSLGAGVGIDAAAKLLAPVTVNLHIKDFWIERVSSMMGFTVTGRPAGKGMLDVPRLLNEIAVFKRCHTAVLELWTTPESYPEATIEKEADWAVQSINYLRPFFS